VALTASFADILDYYFTVLTAHKEDLGLLDVWFGDRDKYPRFPCLTVEGSEMREELNGTARKVGIEFESYLTLLHGGVGDVSDNYRTSVTLAQDVTDFIHARRTHGGLVVHSYVTRMSPGYLNRGRGMIRATQLTVLATSQTLLPMQEVT
jgi:hypothetical protein